MLPTLRPHQQENFEQLRAETMAARDPLLVAACGYGKGTIASVIVHGAVQRGHHVIFAVHGKSLVVDMSERVRKLGIEHGVLMGGERRERWHKVQVASIDTLHRMEHPPKASLILIDEAHMALSPTWRKTIARYPQARVIGMTATPIRLDGKGLGKKTGGLFDSMVLGPSEEELIGLENLVPSRVLAPPMAIGDVKKTAGDFNQKALAAVCDKTKLIGDIVEHWKRHANEKTAAFGVDQAHAKHIQESFLAAGIQWAYVDAQTPQEERAQIWKDLDSGSLMGVSSVGCIAVGWDHPIVSCLIMARPTASLGLWRQMLGRGSRPHPGKYRFLVLDHSGNTHRHAPFGMFEDSVPWSLDGAAVKDSGEKKPPQIATCKQSFQWPDGRHQPPNIINGLQWPCYATFRAGPKECPYCGLPQKVKARAVEVQQGDLKEIVRATTAEQVAARVDQRAHYDDLMNRAYERNYKPAWVGLQFKAKYGFWPYKAWEVDWYGNRLNKEMASA
jgi:DNA repair protein RadD